jgi:hypothetical protein
MLMSTDPENHRCTATWMLGKVEINIELANRDAWTLRDFMELVYRNGGADAAHFIQRNVYEALERTP